jgi:soluble lytic murein transglycosylase-like protein
MRRISLLIALLLTCTQAAFAQESAPAASDVMAQNAVQQDTRSEEAHHKVSETITRRFGIAREKAQAIATAVMSSASKYSLPPALLLAIISIESRFKETARGANNATGLMQVVPSAHKKLVRDVDLTEPEANIEVGSAILHGYLKSAKGDVDAALKNYGGSSAYAQKVSLRAKTFEPVTAPAQ